MIVTVILITFKAGKYRLSPLNIMQLVLILEKKAINDAFAVFERRLDEFEALVEKLGLA